MTAATDNADADARARRAMPGTGGYIGADPVRDDPVGDYAETKAKPKPVKFKLPSQVVRAWRGNPLLHESTGLAKLDEFTGGGFVYGSRVYLLGAPDAGKTMLQDQLADEYVKRGVVVGILAVDEEADDTVTRLAQRRGRLRKDCESRSDAFVDRLAMEFASPNEPTIYDPEETIERAAGHLADVAKERGLSSVALFVDSVQSVTCDAVVASQRELSERQVINANVRAIRHVATKYKMLVVATSEMNRGAYRNIDDAERAQDDMASGKESGIIEYSARVMIALRRAQDGELIRANVVKNKHGPSYVDFHLAVNRATQTLTDAEPPVDGKTTGADDPTFIKQCAAVHQIIIDHATLERPIGEKGLRTEVAAANLKLGKDKLAGITARLFALGKIGRKFKKPTTEWGPMFWPIIMSVANEAKTTAQPDNTNGAHLDASNIDPFAFINPEGSA